ncbi:hypothetical protein BNJ_00271 [Kaumoebavirus]|uniref:hypothetical protein n=1 Tax=Kaumoebavirus TaxID=1859492 RepID=UPI0009C29359|nr:hypothetical protein BNJ_00271 [Kaumoebavirus]ARA72095.1 hypothetical protein BNJ_00271 [Kaumoebavirus]
MSNPLHKIIGEVYLSRNGNLLNPGVGIFLVHGEIWYMWSDIYDVCTNRKARTARHKRNLGRKPERVPVPANCRLINGIPEVDYIFVDVSQERKRGGGPGRWLVSKNVLDQMLEVHGFKMSDGCEPIVISDESSDESDSSSEEDTMSEEEWEEYQDEKITREFIEDLDTDGYDYNDGFTVRG